MAGRNRENAGLADEAVLEPWPSPAAIIQHVALALYMRAGPDNTVAGLTSVDLATETYLPASDVTSALSILERHGMVSPRPGPGGSTTYLLLIPRRRRPVKVASLIRSSSRDPRTTGRRR